MRTPVGPTATTVPQVQRTSFHAKTKARLAQNGAGILLRLAQAPVKDVKPFRGRTIELLAEEKPFVRK